MPPISSIKQPLHAQVLANAENVPLGNLFRRQFCLSRRKLRNMDGFIETKVDSFTLYSEKSLPIQELRAKGRGQRRYGLILGYAVTGEPDSNAPELPGQSTAQEFWGHVERLVYRLAGKYVVVCWHEGAIRVYGDATMALPVRFAADEMIIGSTVNLCLSRERIENTFISDNDIINSRASYAFGHTCDEKIKSLRVGHYLALSDWSETRFWPKLGDFEEAPLSETGRIVDQMATRLRRIVHRFIERYDCDLPLTGGNDSRNILAAADGKLDQVRQFTTYNFHRPSRFDTIVARKLAALRGVELTVHNDVKEVRIRGRRRGLRRYQHATSGMGQTFSEFGDSIQSMEFVCDLKTTTVKDVVVLKGNVMEALRGAHWKRAQRHVAPNLPFHLKRCLFVPHKNFTPEFVEKWMPPYLTWREALPEDARDAAVDMGFIEHILPKWGSTYIGYGARVYLNPFNDRQLLSMCSNLNLQHRKNNGANQDVLTALAPDLVDVPLARKLMQPRS